MFGPNVTPKAAACLDGSLDPVPEVDSDSSRSLANSTVRRTLSSSLNQQRPALAEDPRATLNKGGLLADAVWNVPALLDLTDSVRSSLKNSQSLGPNDGRLAAFLHLSLANEAIGAASGLHYGIETIRDARLDKLVADLLDKANWPPRIPAPLFAAKQAAGILERKWRQRYKETYPTLDEIRFHMILVTGHLREVSFRGGQDNDPDGCTALWKTRGGEPLSEGEGNLRFEIGHWWLNIVCANRDGIVGSHLEAPTKGRYGIAALPLLSGREHVLENGLSLYVREASHLSAMHVSLMTQVGKKIRILRGHELKSQFAPTGGLRYDGLYTIVQYGHKLDESCETYRLSLVLQRESGQKKSQEELISIPKPSQMDDWQQYEKLEGSRLRALVGDLNFLAWKIKKMREKLEYAQWLVATGQVVTKPVARAASSGTPAARDRRSAIST